LLLFNFSIVIWERSSIIFQGNTQCLLGFHKWFVSKNHFISFLGFLGLRLGLGLRLNKMDLAYVFMSWVLRKFILYISSMYMYVYHIIFCMVLNIWLHLKLLYESLDNVFALHNLQTPSLKSPKLFSCLFNVNLYHSNFAKLHHSHMTLDRSKILCTIIVQNFSSFTCIKWEILLLPWNHFKLGHAHKMIYNSLSTIPKSLRFWETH
jgi:hypothetical protein